jgi:hypothetical protein
MDAHAREAAAAVFGMQDLYDSPAQPVGARRVAGRLVNVWATGDAVMFDAADGRCLMGRIEEACNDDLYLVRTDHGREVVHADSIYPF